MRASLILLPVAALAACNVTRHDAAGGEGGNVHVAIGDGAGTSQQVSITTSGFDANLTLPNLDLGSHMQLEGLKIAPDTKVTNVDVNGKDGADGHGVVRVAFTNPTRPAALIDYYRQALTGAGYSIGAGNGSGLTATKAGKAFALSAVPQGAGSSGTITLAGDE